jgi:WD40 repeat protein
VVVENPTDTTERPKKVLKAFSRALGREAHVLVEYPNLLWQQLYNRLQWEEEVKQVIADLFSQISIPVIGPWMHLLTQFRESQGLIRTFSGHQGAVICCSFSPDGSFIVSGGIDQILRIWGVADGTLQMTLNGHSNHVNSCVFSRDGKFVLSGGKDKTIRIWNAITGNQEQLLIAPFEITAALYSPDGRWILSAGDSDKILLWDSSTGKMVDTFDGKPPIGFLPDGSLIITIKGGAEQVLDIPSGRLLKTYQFNAFNLAISPDGEKIVTGHDHKVKLWETSSGTLLNTYEGHENLVMGCAFSPDGRSVISSCWDMTLKKWNLLSPNPVLNLKGHTRGLSACAFSPDGIYLLSASDDSTLRLWQASDEETEYRFAGPSLFVNACSFSPDGRRFVSASSDGSLRVANSYNGQLLHQLKRNLARDSLATCSYTPDGNYIISSHFEDSSSKEEKSLVVWEAVTGILRRTLKAVTELYPKYAFSQDGRLIVPGTLDGELWMMPDGTFLFPGGVDDHIWILESATGAPLLHLKEKTSGLILCAFSPDGALILTAHRDGKIHLWNAMTGELINTLENPAELYGNGCFSPDGRFIFFSEDEHTYRWETATGHLLTKLEGSKPIAISPDGQYISTHRGFSTLLLELESGRIINSMDGHKMIVSECSWSPDGRFIVTASPDSTVRLWDPFEGKLLSCLYLLGHIDCVTIHPFRPLLVCGEDGGAVYRIKLVNIPYQAIIITAVEDATELKIQCPSCRNFTVITKSQLGTEMLCPTSGCGLRLKINPFVIHMA